MKTLSTFLLFAIFTVGCATPRHESYLDRFHDTRIPKIEFDQQPIQAVLLAMATEWKDQIGTEMPIAVATREIEHQDPTHNLITLRAENISFIEALRIIADLSGYRVTFRENDVVLTDIWPSKNMGFLWTLDEKTRVGLGLGDKPDANEILEALASRGVDLSTGHMKVSFISDDILVINGFRETAGLAHSILVLITTGYDVIKIE